MTMRVPKVLLAAAACAYLFGGPSPVAAGTHLRCFKVRDVIPKQRFQNVTLPSNTGLAAPTGPCTIYVGAKMCCDAVDTTGIPPQPGGGGPTTETTRFCCYKLKCPKGTDLAVGQQDQFGNRTVAFRKANSKLLCAPSSPSGAFLDDASLF